MGEPARVENLTEVYDRCRRGDPGGLDEAYRLFGRGLYGTALRLLGRVEDAEDAMQETFLKLHRTCPDLPPEQLPAWLHRVTANHCLDRLRSRGRWRISEWTPERGPQAKAPSGLRLDLREAVAKLPRKARLVFLLHDVEGFRHADVAEMLAISVGASKSQLFRARSLLRERLGRGEEGRS